MHEDNDYEPPEPTEAQWEEMAQEAGDRWERQTDRAVEERDG